MIDNQDKYNDSIDGWTMRYTAPWIYAYAHQDIDGIVKADIKCIDIIDMQAMPKSLYDDEIVYVWLIVLILDFWHVKVE